MVYDDGAFELCLPSLGFLFTKLTLRRALLGQPIHMESLWYHRADLSRHELVCNIMRCLSCEVSVFDVLGVAE